MLSLQGSPSGVIHSCDITQQSVAKLLKREDTEFSLDFKEK